MGFESILDRPFLPPKADRVALALLACGYAALYVPAWLDLARTVWNTSEQSQGPIILAISFWLLYRSRHGLAELQHRTIPVVAWPLLLLNLGAYAFGRSQDVIMFVIGSQVGVLLALLLMFIGLQSLRVVWFPLFFMLFMVPLPEALVAVVTSPLKQAVSLVASEILHWVGLPVARSGVMLTIGPYHLLVADACAGLNSMFSLEALGMLYMNLMGYTHKVRNIALALLLVPTAFVANTIRVLFLVLITYYLGDAAGQGFLHGFAGVVLFVVALGLMLAIDKLLGLLLKHTKQAPA